MKIAAIPTKYKGVQFRSRLEARWAAFFDLMKWQWEYEPLDLNGWIPDFIIGGSTFHGAFIEVKPIDYRDSVKIRSHTQILQIPELIHARERVPETSRGFIVLGLQPYYSLPDHDALPAIGPVWEPARKRYVHPGFTRGYGQLDIAVGAEGFYPGLMTGLDFTFPNDEIEIAFSAPEIFDFWKEAGNATQWRSPVN